METYNTNLSSIGLSKYYMTPKGKVFNAKTFKEIKLGKDYCFSVLDDNAK